MAIVASAGTNWPEDLLERIAAAGGAADAVRRGRRYAVVLQGDRILAEEIGDQRLRTRSGDIEIEAASVGSAGEGAEPGLSIFIDGALAVSGRRGMAVAVWDSERAEVIAQSLYSAKRTWREGGRAFRIWHPDNQRSSNGASRGESSPPVTR